MIHGNSTIGLPTQFESIRKPIHNPYPSEEVTQ